LATKTLKMTFCPPKLGMSFEQNFLRITSFKTVRCYFDQKNHLFSSGFDICSGPLECRLLAESTEQIWNVSDRVGGREPIDIGQTVHHNLCSFGCQRCTGKTISVSTPSKVPLVAPPSHRCQGIKVKL
jgi:hypothetical protein